MDEEFDQSQLDVPQERGGDAVGNKNVNIASELFFLFVLCAPVGQRHQHDVEFVKM